LGALDRAKAAVFGVGLFGYGKVRSKGQVRRELDKGNYEPFFMDIDLLEEHGLNAITAQDVENALRTRHKDEVFHNINFLMKHNLFNESHLSLAIEMYPGEVASRAAYFKRTGLLTEGHGACLEKGGMRFSPRRPQAPSSALPPQHVRCPQA